MSDQPGCGKGCVWELFIIAVCGVLALLIPITGPLLIVALVLILAIEIVSWMKRRSGH